MILLSLLTLAALAVACGTFALSLTSWLSEWSPSARWLPLPPTVALLVSVTISTLLGTRLLAAWRAWRDHPPSDAMAGNRPKAGLVSRRDFIKFAALEMALGGATLAAAGYITRVEPRRLQVEEVEVPIASLSHRLDGLRIVQLSDLHLSSVVPLAHIQRAVDTAQRLAGELIVITGDYVTESADDALTCARALARLRAPLGVYAILGNHDHWTDAAKVMDTLTASGLTLLRNQGWPIARDGGEQPDLWLAGLDDVWERQDDLEAALHAAPRGLPILLLVHEPDYVDRIADRTADLGIVLQLSGHSHGGQVRLPFAGTPILPYLGQKYPQGLQKVGSAWVYTNRGIGLVRPAVRFNCPPEVTALTLRQA